MEHWRVTVKLRYTNKPYVFDFDMLPCTFIGKEDGGFRIGGIYSANAEDVVWWNKEVVTKK